MVSYVGITLLKVVPFLMPKKRVARKALFFSLPQINLRRAPTNAKKVIYQLKVKCFKPPNEKHQGPINREGCYYYASASEAIKQAKLMLKYGAIDSYEIRKFEEVFEQLKIGD